MKKVTFILAILTATMLAKAQSYVALDNHSLGRYFQWMEDFVELQDGNILTCTRVLNVGPDGYYSSDYGYCFLKLSREDASIMDSVFMPDNYTNFFITDSHPTSDGFLFINQVYDSLSESNFMKIRHFHDDLTFDNEIIAPLVDTVIGGADYFLFENEGFIMLSGRNDGSHTFQRFGFDGTLMDRNIYPDSLCPYWETWGGLKVWNNSPREYVFTGYKPSPRQCTFYVLDSLLQLKETIALGDSVQYPYIWLRSPYNCLESSDGNTYLIATPYVKGLPIYSSYQRGVQITKRDKVTHTNLKTVYFPFHVPQYGGILASQYIVGLTQTKEGYTYLAYGDVTGMNRFSVVLLDSDLNILWQQYYLNLQYYDVMYRMEVLSDGGLGIVGFNAHASKVFALFISNDYDKLEEQGIVVRPYAYYPNPAQDELHLQYSPDVTPKQIELYDLQGRLVKTQRNGLESLNMESLSAGTYTMRVTLESGKTFSDKIIKQ
jgi:hypothetical protein